MDRQLDSSQLRTLSHRQLRLEKISCPVIGILEHLFFNNGRTNTTLAVRNTDPRGSSSAPKEPGPGRQRLGMGRGPALASSGPASPGRSPAVPPRDTREPPSPSTGSFPWVAGLRPRHPQIQHTTFTEGSLSSIRREGCSESLGEEETSLTRGAGSWRQSKMLSVRRTQS